jgi:hypothetical protein
VKDDQGRVLSEYKQPGDAYMGTKEEKSLLARSNIVYKCLSPVWQEVEVDLGRWATKIKIFEILNYWREASFCLMYRFEQAMRWWRYNEEHSD